MSRDGHFSAWNPYLLGAVLIGLGIVIVLSSDRPTRGKHRWVDPGTKKLVGVSIAACGAWGIISAIRRGRRIQRDLEEWSTNFDAKDVGPFLRQVAPHIASGFGEEEIRRIEHLVATTPHDETAGVEFTIEFQGRSMIMPAYVFMDDIESPDVYFGVPEALGELFSRELEKFEASRSR